MRALCLVTLGLAGMTPHRSLFYAKPLGFAVIDFETTGLFPSADRVIEVAVAHVSADGIVEGRWETLVNPERDLGRQDIHRVTATDVLSAPTFAQIAAPLAGLLEGRILVAHNASFDTRFLAAEMGRVGADFPVLSQYACTMNLAAKFLPGAERTLVGCCATLGIPLTDAHAAATDVEATAALLREYLRASKGRLDHVTRGGQVVTWRQPAPTAANWYARPASETTITASTFLASLTATGREPTTEVCSDYVSLLDRSLVDRRFTMHEVGEILEYTREHNLGRDVCTELNRYYFDQLARHTWAIGTAAEAAEHDLHRVAALLGLDPQTVEASMTNARGRRADTGAVVSETLFMLNPGDLVVLTGDMRRERTEWEEILRERGFQTWSSVTKKVRLVAAADPDTQSGKARKARQYKIPVIGEASLERLTNL